MQQQLDIIRGMLDNNAGWFPGFTHLAGDPLPQTSFAELPNGSLCKVANSNTTNLRDLIEMSKLELYQYTGSSTARSLFKRDEKNRGILRTELASQKMRACVENESCSGLVEMRGQWGRGSSGLARSLLQAQHHLSQQVTPLLGHVQFQQLWQWAASLLLNDRCHSRHFI